MSRRMRRLRRRQDNKTARDEAERFVPVFVVIRCGLRRSTRCAEPRRIGEGFDALPVPSWTSRIPPRTTNALRP